MRVAFFLPEKYLPPGARRAQWADGSVQVLERSGKAACAHCWIYQTWLELREAMPEAELVYRMPDDGIVVTLAGFLGRKHRPAPRRFTAAVVADTATHPFGQVQILQNAAHARALPGSVFVPLWPHPNLIPRDSARGGRFEHVDFFGVPQNLAPELREPAWADRVRRELGLTFRSIDASGWHDYSETDCALAIRSFDGAPHRRKPSTKLYNAWMAGVPFIGGSDSAYAADGAPGSDYLAARTGEELLVHLKTLRDNPALRERLVAAGSVAVRPFTRDAVRERWVRLLRDELPVRAEHWFALSPGARALSTGLNRLRLWADRLGPA
jgi:hypothetical protein